MLVAVWLIHSKAEPEVALPSISLFWNPFLLKHQIPTFAGKKNLFTVLRSIADRRVETADQTGQSVLFRLLFSFFSFLFLFLSLC